MSKDIKEEPEETAEDLDQEQVNAMIRVIEYLMGRRRERLAKEDKAHE